MSMHVDTLSQAPADLPAPAFVGRHTTTVTLTSGRLIYAASAGKAYSFTVTG